MDGADNVAFHFWVAFCWWKSGFYLRKIFFLVWITGAHLKCLRLDPEYFLIWIQVKAQIIVDRLLVSSSLVGLFAIILEKPSP